MRCYPTGRWFWVQAKAWPFVVGWILADWGSNWIELDIPVTPQQVMFGLDQAGPMPTLPQSPGSMVLFVDCCGVSASDLSRCYWNSILVMRRDKKMNMVWHQAICMHTQVGLVRKFCPKTQIEIVVIWFKKRSGFVHAPLNYMIGVFGKVIATWSSHVQNYRATST